MQDNNKFEEQNAPQKNTDGAFVKVGEDGKPQMPEKEKHNTASQQTDENDLNETETGIKHR